MNAPVIIPPRKALTRNQRAKLFDAHKGICVICKNKIHAERGESWIDEHINPREISADDSLANRGPAHVACAREKTKTDVKLIAKVKRNRANHLGIKKPRSITRWRKFNGTIVTASRSR
jgi:5-methylcytosine-specific restriction protein A